MPNLPVEVEAGDEKRSGHEEDAEDALSRLDREKKAEEAAVLKRRSQALQRSLPRPFTINIQINGQDPVKQEIEKEMLTLLKFDEAKYPTPGAKNKKRRKAPWIDHFTDLELQKARELIFLESETTDKEKNMKGSNQKSLLVLPLLPLLFIFKPLSGRVWTMT